MPGIVAPCHIFIVAVWTLRSQSLALSLLHYKVWAGGELFEGWRLAVYYAPEGCNISELGTIYMCFIGCFGGYSHKDTRGDGAAICSMVGSGKVFSHLLQCDAVAGGDIADVGIYDFGCWHEHGGSFRDIGKLLVGDLHLVGGAVVKFFLPGFAFVCHGSKLVK